jgi:hypothetical protein
MAIMNIAPQGAKPSVPKGMAQPSTTTVAKTSKPPAPGASPKGKKTRGNIGRMLREKL